LTSAVNSLKQGLKLALSGALTCKSLYEWTNGARPGITDLLRR
jgi:hypothetical protein